MFLISVKSSTLKVWGVLLALGIVLGAASLKLGSVKKEAAEAMTASNTAKANEVKCATNEERIAFLNGLGWQVESEPAEVAEIVIPQVFNSVYNNYNAIQKNQGYDLSSYRGVRAKRWTYKITNYPDKTSEVRANLIVYGGRLIGGDISSVAIDGFMTGLNKKNAQTGVSAKKADLAAETYVNHTTN